ncbi:MAG: winged helix-turn-helix domain-containing protein [Nitrososphaeraceae archaeon]
MSWRLSQNFLGSINTMNVRKKNKAHRSRYEIVDEILRVVLLRNQSPSSLYMCKPLHIEYGARLTYRQATYYTTILVEFGFLTEKKSTKSRPSHCYEITEKGRRYIHIFGGVEDDLRPRESM